MRGLIRKDIYMTAAYCRMLLLIGVLFLALGLVGEPSSFILAYPFMMLSTLPVTLISYDGHSRWESYSSCLPYSRGQLVSAKYIMGLMGLAAITVLSGLTQGIRLAVLGRFQAGEFFGLMSGLMVSGLLPGAICLPLLFKLGYEKGRMAYMVTLGVFCSLTVGLGDMLRVPSIGAGMPILLLAGAAAVYGISWYLSIRIYSKREL